MPSRRDRNEVISASLQMLGEFQDALDCWIRNDVCGRYAELRCAPSRAVSLDEAFARFEAKHRAALFKAEQ